MMKMRVFIFILVMSFANFVLATNAEIKTQDRVAATAVEQTGEAAKLAEDQIPLSIEATKKVSDNNSSTAKALMSMTIVAILLATSYYFIRKYKYSNTINKSNMQIKVLSRHYLGPKKSLAIVHVAGESILLGVTDSNISMIKSLSLIDDEVPANLPNTFDQTLVSEVASVVPKTSAANPQAKSIELDEEFSFSNVSDSVSKKIKSMRSFS